MHKSHSIVVVVPAHNEARHIAQVVTSIPTFVDHIFVVDDCSTDNTAAIVRGLDDNRLKLLATPKNQGVGGATMLGYQKAIEVGSDVVVKMDGDGQMSPDHLELLIDALIDQNYDYAKGNRFLASGTLHAMPRHRLLGNVVLTFVNKMASGYWHVFDPQNGYTAIRTTMLRRLELSKINQRYFFENDMLIALNLFNARVRDIAIPALYGNERSELNPLKASIVFPLLFIPRFWGRIFRKYVVRDFSPIALFLFAGLLLFGWGVGFGVYHWIHSIVSGKVATTGTVMLAVLPLILGFQLILQAIVLDINETPK